MELTKNYDGKRWKLVYGDYCGMEAHAVDLVQAAIKRFVPYILPVYRYDNVPDDGRNTVYVGTKDSNPFVGEKLADVVLFAHRFDKLFDVAVVDDVSFRCVQESNCSDARRQISAAR